MRTGYGKAMGLIAAILLTVGLCGPGSAIAAIPFDEGHHLHAEITNHPVEGFAIPRSPYTFHVNLKAHNQIGEATSFRVADYSTVRQTIPIHLGPCADCSLAFDFTVDFSTWTCGRHELRWIVNVPHNSEGNRQYTTSRTQVTLAGCTTNRSGRSIPFNGGGAWYTNHDYATIYDLSPDTAHRPGGTIIGRVAQDATSGCAFINPDAHHGSMGTGLGCWTGQSNHTVQIPASANVGDKLVLYATDGFNAGLIRITLGDGSPRATTAYEFQSWWSATGIILPPSTPPGVTPTPTPTPVITPSPTIPPTPDPSVCVP